MLQVAYHTSSAAPTVFAAYINQRLQIQLELLMMSGMLLEAC
jgi:hypothetical protein